MKAHLTLNVIDIDRLVRAHFEDSDVEITGYDIESYDKVLLQVSGGMLTVPVRHELMPEHATLKDLS